MTIGGLRHHDCYRTLSQLDPLLLKNARHDGLIEEGFINTNNAFLTREEAFAEALRCGQLSASVLEAKAEWPIRKNILFSEDIY